MKRVGNISCPNRRAETQSRLSKVISPRASLAHSSSEDLLPLPMTDGLHSSLSFQAYISCGQMRIQRTIRSASALSPSTPSLVTSTCKLVSPCPRDDNASSPDLDRPCVFDSYFSSLHPFVFHLTRSIHTPRFLRDTSPFLTTALACLCATFDPASQSTVPALFNHLQLINTRIWSEGLKSLEIVQAYMLLMCVPRCSVFSSRPSFRIDSVVCHSFFRHWTPIANNWGDDRRWGWLGTAIRIATEIKLHKTLNQTTYDFYRSVTPLCGDDAFQQLSDDRIRSWRLISVCETASVSISYLLCLHRRVRT